MTKARDLANFADNTNLNDFADTFTLPTVDGTDGQAIKTDGAGNLEFADSSGGGGIVYTVKTTTCTASAGEGVIADTSGGPWSLGR